MKKYNYELVATNIDTLEVTSPTYIIGTYEFLSHDSSRRMTMNDGITPKYKYRVNPSKALIDTSTFEGYKSAMSHIMSVATFTNAVKTRIDFAFDFYGEDYERISKCNKLLLLLIAFKYNLKNRYQSIDMLTTEQKTLRVSNQTLEIEAYNKILQEPNSFINCRVEFRSKRLYDDSDEEGKEKRELHKWFERMGSSVTSENFNSLIAELTNHILKRYKKEKSERNFDEMAFLYKYEDFIFTTRQMKNLFAAMGYVRTDKKLSQYKQRYKGVEFFSLREIREHTLIFRNAAEIYMTAKSDSQKYPETGMI